jgi:hypothetical protein
MGQHGGSQHGQQVQWDPDAPTIAIPVHRVGPLGSLHDRQRRWPGLGRFLWWAFLLPVAIFAWSSWRLRGVVRLGGYVVAGWVLLFGVVLVAASAAPPVPTTVAQADPAPALTVASPAAAPPPVAAPVVAVAAPAPVVAPPAVPAVAPASTTPRPVAPRTSHVKPAATRASAPPASSGSSGGDTYTNVDGNQVERPVAAASQPAGATAKCKDGTWSFSQHHSGTCSGHGGVAQFL